MHLRALSRFTPLAAAALLAAVALAALAALAACSTTPNEAVCCVSDADCARLGLSEPRPCGAGQACKAFACVAAECATSAACTDPGAPVCVNSLCVARCEADADCAGAAGGPICADDGACVGCTSPDQCTAAAPFCDAADRACRGCIADAECASGVCLEADGRCADEAEVSYVTAIAGEDTGTCTRSAPCASLAYALLQLQHPTRLVVHVKGGQLIIPQTNLEAGDYYIDGTNTTLSTSTTVGPVVRVAMGGQVTLSNVVMATAAGPSVTVDAGGAVRLHNTHISGPNDASGPGVITTGGIIVAARASFTGYRAIWCTSGTLSIDECRFTAGVSSSNCQLTVTSSVFDFVDGAALGSSGPAHIENNLFIQAYELADTVAVVNATPSSTVRFNTFVNTSSVISDGVALYCDSTLEVTSNIFAYGTMSPHGTSTCTATYSLYDASARPEQTAGLGNKVADRASIFLDRAARDFHLAPGSAARGSAQPNTGVTRDLEGRLRPSPIGSLPDMGALEAP